MTFTTIYGDRQMLVFPLSRPPSCKKCRKPCIRESRGKRFCYCCPCGVAAGQKGPSTWGTWDDNSGIKAENPVCDCGYYCRVSLNSKTGQLFQSCSVGQCNMTLHRTGNRGSPRQDGNSAVSSPQKTSTWTAPSSPLSSPSPSTRSIAPIVSGNASPSSIPNKVPDQEFVRLLDHAVKIASQMKFPSQDMDMSDMLRALNTIDGPSIGALSPGRSFSYQYRIKASTDFERHCKVGAAGELFVFTLLCRVITEKGGKVYQEDWKSNMRNLVKEHHPGWSHWPEWTERETADIVFPDTEGVLTAILIENGYLDYQTWVGQKPLYMIEVKTTLSDKNKEFYLSVEQHQRMQEYADPKPSKDTQPIIYMIARVSNLQEEDVRLRLMLDPETMRKGRKLRFKQVWVVEEVV